MVARLFSARRNQPIIEVHLIFSRGLGFFQNGLFVIEPLSFSPSAFDQPGFPVGNLPSGLWYT